MCSITTEENDEVQKIYTTGVQILYAKGPYSLFWAGSPAAIERITKVCVPKILYCCALYSVQGVLRGKINILAHVIMAL